MPSNTTTKIMPCTCKSKYQDERYGKGNRVHNKTAKYPSGGGCRCTSCGLARS